MTAQIDFLGDPIFQGVNGQGIPIDGGLVWCYDAGTDNPRDMFETISDAINNVDPLDNPLTLDSSGRASIVYSGASKFVLENNDIDPDTGHGTVIWTADNVGRFGNTVIDPNGNIIVEYDYVSDAVNYLEIRNAQTDDDPTIEAVGADDDIGINLKAKGSISSVTISNDADYFSLPTTDGPLGYVITANGDHTSSWTAPPGAADTFPPGVILDYGGAAAPVGWLECDGSAVSRATYSDLFTAIGTTWGAGDGVNTFNVPNFERRVRVGSGGTGTATLGNAVGNTGGAETVTLTSAQIPAHTHPASSNSTGAHTHLVPNPATIAASGAGVNGVSGTSASGSAGTHSHTITVSNNVGGGGSHNNIQPSAVVLAIIKT